MRHTLLFVSGCGIITGFYLLFAKFFPTINGTLGQDYNYFFPYLLDGAFWFKTNGLFSVPWFTPSFGGGLPGFPNPQSIYYSVPQFLTFFLNPLTSVIITFFLFGIAGFVGQYKLLKKCFHTSSMVALYGATLFLFNGFFVHRMIIGHITYHAYMLLPFFFTSVFSTHKLSKKTFNLWFSQIAIGSLVIAYMIYSGAFYVIPSLLLTTIICGIALDIANKSVNYTHLMFNTFLSVLIGCCLGAARLNASLSFLSLFPRNSYPLPGIASISDLIQLCFLSLFWQPDADFACSITVNKLFYLEPHEYEFGITVFPLIIIFTGMLFTVYEKFARKTFQWFSWQTIIKNSALLLLLAIPLFLNYYSSSWNNFLKTIPFIKNSSTNLRWLSVYIPFFIVKSCTIIDQSLLRKYKNSIALLGIASVLLFNSIKDMEYYNTHPRYDPEIVILAHQELIKGNLKPKIEEIKSTAKIAIGNKIKAVPHNDLHAVGFSQRLPYEPLFGYKLESFPVRTLKDGPVMMSDPISGTLNLKNPAGYLFPKENNCSPGDHFQSNQIEDAEKFRSYEKFQFVISSRQVFANCVTIISLFLFLFYLLFLMWIKMNKILRGVLYKKLF